MQQILKTIKDLRQKKIIGLDMDEGSYIATELIGKPKQISITRFINVLNLQELTKISLFKEAGLGIDLFTDEPDFYCILAKK